METKPAWTTKREAHGSYESRLLPFGTALALSITALLIGMAVLTLIVFAFLSFPKMERSSSISLADLLALLQLEFAVLAGGGLVGGWVFAYRKQRVEEAEKYRQRIRSLLERYTQLVSELSQDQQPAAQLAAVHSLAILADEWPENRQACIDVFCAYLRMPYESESRISEPLALQQALQLKREVRYTIIRIIAEHLKRGATVSWQGLDFDFTGCVFDGGDFSGAIFTGGKVSFRQSIFTSGEVRFHEVVFSGADVRFDEARFSGATVSFDLAVFVGGVVSFRSASFTAGRVTFHLAAFSGGTIDFHDALLTPGVLDLGDSSLWRIRPDFDQSAS